MLIQQHNNKVAISEHTQINNNNNNIGNLCPRNI
jgi:hypothetical protein